MYRRNLLKMGAASPLLLTAVGFPSRANEMGYMKFELGAMKLTIISDGHMVIPSNMLGTNQDPALVSQFFNEFGINPDVSQSALNHMLIETPEGETILIDASTSGRFMPETSGSMMDNLMSAGIDPDSIGHVVFTHAHPDHIWGVRDDFDEPFLPDAAYYLSQGERDYWMQDDLVNQVNPEDQQFVLGAVNSIETIDPVAQYVQDGDQIAPGVTVIATPGHTLGHMSVMIESEGQALLVTGDAFSHAIMNFVHPDWTQQADMDPEQTVATRKRLLDMVSADKILISAYHFPFPGVGEVQKVNDSYEFIPMMWNS